MQRISSNLTLFLKIFLPVFWIVFFGVFTLAVLLSNVEQFSAFNFGHFKLGLVGCFILGVLFFYFTLMKLKRVELDEQFVYASNYFKNYRYPYHNIEKMTERDLGLFYLVKIYMKTPGKFGKRITFLLDEYMLKDFLKKHPEVAKEFQRFKIEEKK